LIEPLSVASLQYYAIQGLRTLSESTCTSSSYISGMCWCLLWLVQLL